MSINSFMIKKITALFIFFFCVNLTYAHHTPKLRSHIAAVYDQSKKEYIYMKNHNLVAPIASITKLMTAIVTLESGLPLLETLKITRDDIDRYKNTSSKIRIGSKLMRSEMLKLSLMASENRAASALARNYPGGTKGFVKAMNQKAKQLGMKNTHFVDSTGLRPQNVSTALDLIKLVEASSKFSIISKYTTTSKFSVEAKNRYLQYVNSNRLVRSSSWSINLSKTGYIREAGRCLVMKARIQNRPIILVLLDSYGKLTRIGDANRIKAWLGKKNN